MEISHIRGFSELGMEDPCFNFQWPVNSFDELNTLSAAAAFGDNMYNHSTMFDLKSSLESPDQYSDFDRPMKQLKSNSWNSCTTDPNPQPPSPDLVHYANNNSNYTTMTQVVSFVKPKEETVSSKINHNAALPVPTSDHVYASATTQGQYGNSENYVLKAASHGTASAKRVCSSNKQSPQAQDHILAERKRREKLSQRFIALSALVPGLKKMDKASVLGDAVKYVKQLQDRVKTLEEQTRTRTTQSVVFVKKYEVLTDGTEGSSQDNLISGAPVHDQLPEIEARINGNDVLIRIHCEKKYGVLEKTIAEMEKLHLLVTNTTSLSFGTYALDITIIAKMNKEYNMTLKELVKNLRSVFKQFM